MTKFVIGAQMYSLRDRTQDAKGLRETLKAVKAMGYNCAQISGIGGGIAPEETRDALKEAGLSCPSTHCDFTRYEREIDEMIRIHKLWDCPYPGIGSMPGVFREGGREGFIAFARRAEAVAERLEDAGLRFIYHNHAFELQRFDGVTGLELLMEYAPKHLMFEIDTYWIQAGGGDPLDWIERVRGRMDVVHFKDMAGCVGNAMTTMTPVGEGNLNWPRILKACDDIGVRFAFVEQDNAVETDSLACMRTSRENLARLGGRF